MLQDTLSFIYRNIMWVALGALALYFLTPGTAIMNTILMIVLFEAIFLGLAGAALFVYTKIDFVDAIMKGDDGKLNSVERHSIMALLGYIFLGVHLSGGLIVLGVYIAQFAG